MRQATTTTIEPLVRRDFDELLAFEKENRSYFAHWISDRGDEYFAHFTELGRSRLTEQENGTGFYFVVRDGSGSLIGRVNIVDFEAQTASIGYRIAEAAIGRGHASRAVQLAGGFARDRGIRRLVAMTTENNLASRQVLSNCDFKPATGDPPFVLVAGERVKMLHFALDLVADG